MLPQGMKMKSNPRLGGGFLLVGLAGSAWDIGAKEHQGFPLIPNETGYIENYECFHELG
jgi:hypothetical protein